MKTRCSGGRVAKIEMTFYNKEGGSRVVQRGWSTTVVQIQCFIST
jgi:hypothetical protein